MQVVQLACATVGLDGQLERSRAHRAQRQVDATTRGPQVPLRQCEIARGGAGLDQRAQAAAVRRIGQRGAGIVAKGLRQVKRGHRVRNDLGGGDSRALHQQSNPQQALISHRPLEQQAMIAQPVTVVGRIDDQGLVQQPQVAQRDFHPAHLVVDQRDHAVVIGDQRTQLLVGLVRCAGRLLAEVAQPFVRHFRLAFEAGTVPPGAPVQIKFPVPGQVHLVSVVQAAPGLRGVERMMWIGERGPYTKGLVLVLAQIVDGTVPNPGRVVPGHGQGGAPGLVGVCQGRQRLAVQVRARVAITVGVVPAFIMLAQWRLHGREVIVPLEHQFDPVKAHVRPVPVGAISGAAFPALGRAGGLERVGGLEVRLADQGRRVAMARQGPGKTACTCVVGKIDAVIRDTVGTRQQASQDGGARRLANQIGGDAGRKASAVAGHLIEVRSLDFPTFEPVAVATLLIGGNEDDVVFALCLCHAVNLNGRLPNAAIYVAAITLLVRHSRKPWIFCNRLMRISAIQKWNAQLPRTL